VGLVLNKISTPILFADDTSVIIDELDRFVFQDRFIEVLNILNLWFNANLLSLNFSKTHYITFTTKNIFEQGDYISVANSIKKISSSCFTKFLGINITNTLSWKRHLDQLLSKLNTACMRFKLLNHM
jgi:hypothetical protein